MNLVRAELSRFVWRRGIALVLLAGIAVVAILAVRTAWDTRPPSASEVATATATANIAAHDAQTQALVRECQKHPARFLGRGASVERCASELVPSVDSLLPRQPLSLASELNTSGARVAVLLAAAVVIAAATFAGADWQSGSMRTQLITRRRRSAVWGAKALAVAWWSALYMAVGYAIYWVILGSVAEDRGIGGTAGLASSTVGSIAAMGGRAVALAAGVGLGAFALTMVLRYTVATLGLLFAYAAGGEVLLALLPLSGAGRWSVGNNLFGWLQPDFRYAEQSLRCGSVDACGRMHALGNLDAGLFLGGLLLVALVISFVAFTRRDI